jgi:hypothetical protein
VIVKSPSCAHPRPYVDTLRPQVSTAGLGDAPALGDFRLDAPGKRGCTMPVDSVEGVPHSSSLSRSAAVGMIVAGSGLASRIARSGMHTSARLTQVGNPCDPTS